MSIASESWVQPKNIPAVGNPTADAAASAERWMAELHALLRELEAVSASERVLPPVFNEALDSQLVQVRLGVAASLFSALQCKNAAVAGHALRVALTCSAWATRMEMPDEDRDAIEVAALLHDVGVIAAPDHILLKAGKLSDDEAAVMARARRMSLEILRRGCASPKVLAVVENVSAWYDGSQPGFAARGRAIPLGARMIAVVEAFDAMTTDHVYRPAISHERAAAELFACAGTQFDPELVQQFNAICQEDAAAMRWEAARRWLRSLDPAAAAASCWEPNCSLAPPTEPAIEAMFQNRLLENMYDAVVFIDAAGRVVLWNHGAERLTGIGAAAVRGQRWQPTMLGLSNEHGRPIHGDDCPVHVATDCGAQSLRRLTILGRAQQSVAVDVHAIPVLDRQGITQGTVLLFHDASSELSLEQRCQALHEKATKDPLTQVANRAEFDRVHEMFVAAHQQQQVPCSLLMCDLDRFKSVNDTYGHQAGDDAIRSIAAILKSSCRPGDLVARYGGEEFVVLCADCDNAAAARRAEQLRAAFSQIEQPRMNGRTATVSFGVTEIQPGDTAETMLRRADRALLMAKSNGRNTVVQLGSGRGDEDQGGISPDVRGDHLVEQRLITSVPIAIAIEKLRGFVADHRARIISVDANHVKLEIDLKPSGRRQRLLDRPTTFGIELQFEEEHVRRERVAGARTLDAGTTWTKIKIAISPLKGRDRRHADAAAQARGILVSFRSYLMAYEEQPDDNSGGALSRVKRILAPWTK